MTRMGGDTIRLICKSLFLLYAWGVSVSLYAQLNTENVIVMGRNALGAEDYVTAIRYFNEVIEAKPFLEKPYYYRAYAKFLLDDYIGSEADCSSSIRINPYQVEVYRLRGLCRSHIENVAGAIEDYTYVLQRFPNDQATRFNRGLCYFYLHENAKAEAEMTDILKRWPGMARAYKVLIQLAFNSGDTVKAMGIVDTLLWYRPADSDGWKLRGQYALERQEYALSDTCLTKAIVTQPNNYELYLLRALARNGYNRLGASISDYDKVISLIPEHFVAHYNRGLLRALIGDNNRAIEDFSFVLNEEPNNILARYNRALLRQQTGDFNGAVNDFTYLLKQYPNFLYGYLVRAQCRRRLGDIKGALNDESMVARANLDVTFGQRRRPIKKVRSMDDHRFDHYDQLIGEDTDSMTRSLGHLFAKDNFGLVQKRYTEAHLLPAFILTFLLPGTERRYYSDAYLPEVQYLEKKLANEKIRFTAEMNQLNVIPNDMMEKIDTVMLPDSLERQLVLSIILSDAYNYEKALSVLNKSNGEAKLNETKFLIHLQTAAVILRQNQLQTDNNVERKINDLLRVEIELNKAELLSPNNVYVLYNRACWAAMNGDNVMAICLLKKSLDIDPRFPEAYYNRGILYWQMGDIIHAKSDFSRAGELGLFKGKDK